MKVTTRFCVPPFAARLGAVALVVVLAGCVSPPDPYCGDRPGPTWLNSNEQKISLNSSKSQSPTSEIIKASSSTSYPVAPDSFSPEEAVAYALQNNPTLHAARLQRGLAEGGVVIARTYPFNPIAETYEQPDVGPKTAGITNHFQFQATVRLDLELRGQGKHRQSAAEALLTRTEWEIATQELLVSVATARAFNSVLYRKRKLDVVEDTIRLNELVVDVVKKLVDAGRLRPADLLVARTELDANRALLGQGKVALAVARSDLRHQFGSLNDTFEVKGELDLPIPTIDQETYVKAAFQVRPDLQARKATVSEAQARLRLQVADRYGNISFGPSYQVDDTSTSYIGFAFFAPIPVLNNRQGEILQAQATVSRSIADVREIEVHSEQEVQAALIRLAEAKKWADSYVREVLPNLRKASQDMERLLQQNDPGVDVIKVIDVQRNYLRAFDSYLDALYEVSQSRVDLAAAVGDPALALGLYTHQLPAPQKLPSKP
jgi:outer membrane protein TolC